jgi:hypothetical protein
MTIAPADMGGRAGKILDRFPSFMLAPTPDKVLAAVAVTLGKDLDECERLATRIQRAHRLAAADEASDLLRLAALLALHPADFFILHGLQRGGMFALLAEQANVDAFAKGAPGAAAPPLAHAEREQRGYDAYVDALRRAVTRTVAVLLDGCGTIWALLEGTAVLLDAEPLAAGKAVELLDPDPVRGGFLHRMRVRHHVMEAGVLGTREGSVTLVENPLVDRVTGDTARFQRERFPAVRGGFYPGPVDIQITGIANRTVGPMVINRTAHEGVGFAGALKHGQKLVFTADGKALLDGADVTARAYCFRGGLVDDPALPEGTQPEDEPPWHRTTVRVTPVGALDRAVPGPAITPVEVLPTIDLPIGKSEWRFSVTEGAFDASRFDEAVHPLPDGGNPRPSVGRVRLSWKENDPFAVTVMIPAQLSSLEGASVVDDDLPALVRAGLERFRAAGIRLDVRYFDEWILGQSVLAGIEEGAQFDPTALPIPALTT